MPRAEVLHTDDIATDRLDEIHRLLVAAFGAGFSAEDWAHSLGGWHVVLSEDGAVVAHAAVVARPLWVASRPVRAGYVEAVATAPVRQGHGLGSAVMREVAAVVRQTSELGALSTGRHAFYERLGWERWRGPTYVMQGPTRLRTPDEDAGIMVLRFGASATIDVTGDIACEARAGDDW